jgi:YHS domain-containing protein
MAVDPDAATETRTVDGRQWFFCAAPCAEAFVGDPARYAPD